MDYCTELIFIINLVVIVSFIYGTRQQNWKWNTRFPLPGMVIKCSLLYVADSILIKLKTSNDNFSYF